MNDFDRKVIEEFRANEGRVGGPLAGTPMLLLHHTGARSGMARVTPLAYHRHRDGRYVVTASNGGSADHPRWYSNVRRNRSVEVEVGGHAFTAVAEELEGTSRDELWPTLVAASPILAEFQRRAARRIPIVVLVREDRLADKT